MVGEMVEGEGEGGERTGGEVGGSLGFCLMKGW